MDLLKKNRRMYDAPLRELSEPGARLAFALALCAAAYIGACAAVALSSDAGEECYTDSCIAERYCADADDVDRCIFGDPQQQPAQGE